MAEPESCLHSMTDPYVHGTYAVVALIEFQKVYFQFEKNKKLIAKAFSEGK